MEIKKAVFVKSSPRHQDGPSDGRNEYAFIGRSNVGKSSLINMLTGVKGLAKTSQRPGKTLLINYFEINETLYIVDLPGYGFAAIPKVERDKLSKMINGYIANRMQMANLFVLIDVRHAPMQIDLDFMNRLGHAGVPFSIVFTKADKISKLRVKNNVQSYREELLKEWEELPPIFITSAESGLGKQELLEYITSIESGSAGSSEVKEVVVGIDLTEELNPTE